MINQLEIPMYLEEALPEFSDELKAGGQHNAADMVSALTSFTCSKIREHNYSAVRRSFTVAEKLFSKGNEAVKNAIESIFVYSFTRMFMTYPEEKPKLLSLIPMTLYTLYISQVCHKGC